MSRVGKLPVRIPESVKVSVDKGSFTVEGPKGKLTQKFAPQVSITVDDGAGVVTRRNESKRARSMHGLYRQLLQNMVTGVSDGFTRVLVISGVGFRAEVNGQSVMLNLGYSNPIEYIVPDGVTVEAESPTRLVVRGIDKMLVGKVASEIRSLRPPEPYKGKGVKYEDEQIRRKVGKSGVK